jgi:DNA-binding NarL/FixJ family response regulator
MTAFRIIIADDHPLFRDALRLTVARMLPRAEAVEAESFERLRARLEEVAETDLVLLDLNMPGTKGFSGLLYLRAQFPAVPVAIISANEEPRVVRAALDLGAIGYIPKSAGASEIRAALTALLAGKSWLPASLGLDRSSAGSEGEFRARLTHLTPQQVRVLMMLSEGLPNKQIAHGLGVSEATAKAHVSAILQKLKVDNRTQAVILAKRLVMDTDAAPAPLRPADLIDRQ